MNRAKQLSYLIKFSMAKTDILLKLLERQKDFELKEFEWTRKNWRRLVSIVVFYNIKEEILF